MTELEALQNQVKRLAAERDALKAENEKLRKAIKLSDFMADGIKNTISENDKLKADKAELLWALGDAIPIIHAHYPKDKHCCDMRIERIKNALAKHGGG